MFAVQGLGLHTGAPARVSLARRRGETTFNGAPLSTWRAVKAERATVIVCAEARARTVEHLFAALAGAGARGGVDVRLEGPEAPILDGCARAWSEAVATLGVSPMAPTLEVRRAAVIEVATSRYEFAPSASSVVSVELAFGDRRLAPCAQWNGDPDDFRTRIATARTFCFAHEVQELARAGLAQHVTPETVVVIGPEILACGAPFSADEPARHKLLDLVGDLFLYGGPPRGSIFAYRPGHWSTHEAMLRALESGVVVSAPFASA